MASAAGARRRAGKGASTATTSLLDIDDQPAFRGGLFCVKYMCTCSATARPRSKTEEYAESSTQLSAKHWIAVAVYLIVLLLFLIKQHLHVPEPLPTNAPSNVFSEGMSICSVVATNALFLQAEQEYS